MRNAAVELGISHAAVAQMLRMLEDKRFIKREGRYSRTIHILNQMGEVSDLRRLIEVPIIGQITAGLPMYAQQEWDGNVFVDSKIYRGKNLFELRVKGEPMKDAGILDMDFAWDVAQGNTAKGDPLHWSVYNGKLDFEPPT